MMKLTHIKKGKEVNITQLVTKIKWSGDAKQVARVLSFGIASSSTDKSIPNLDLKLGDMIKMYDGSKEVYRGYIFSRDKALSGNEIDITSYDGLVYLLKSKGTYNFKNVTPGSITKQICKTWNIPLGTVVNGRPIKRIFDGDSIYDIIMTAYTFESNRTKKQYIPLMDRGKLNILEKGKKVATYELDPSKTVIDAKYSESMENSINLVKMYSEGGNYLGQVTLKGVPGRLQDIYTGDEGKAAARSLLKGIEKTASLEALGDFECITGNAVKVKEKHTGLVGLFYIDTDEHTFENGQHMMSLGLSFQNLMDSQMAGENPDEQKESSSSSSSSGTVSGSTPEIKIWNFFIEQGFTADATAGIMGNLKQESQLDPNRKQSGGGPGRGLLQWSVNDRWSQLTYWAKSTDKNPWALETQLEYIMKELTGNAADKYNAHLLNKNYGGLNKLKKMSLRNACIAFEKSMTRAGKPNMARRLKYAEEIKRKYINASKTTITVNSSGNKRDKFINSAQSMIGYSYSQANRMGSKSADCSSLVGRAMKMAGITNNAQLTTRSILNDSRFTRISKKNARKGDILWEKGHMGIYMGGNKTLEARWSTKKVGYSSLGKRFSYAYRIKGI